MNFIHYLRERISTDAQPALVTPKQTCSYAELYAAADRVHGWLLAKEIRPGDRVPIVADNSFFWCAAYLGLLQAGVVAVPLMPNIEKEQCRRIMAGIEPRALFIQQPFVSAFAELVDRSIFVVTDQAVASVSEGAAAFDSINLLSELAEGSLDLRAFEPANDASHLASIIFTSGSTGLSRGVMISHRNLRANTESILQYLQLSSADRMMAVLPFSYCFGTSLLHTHLAVGASVAIGFPFMFPDRVLHGINHLGCTGFAGVPSHYQILLRRSSLPSMTFPTLRHVQQAGGRMSGEDLLELQKYLPTTRIYVMYGQTEATARLSYLPPEKLASKPNSIGHAIPGVQLSIEDESGREAAPGQLGEIVAGGDNITQGYWNDSVETSKVFRNGKLHTGDIAYRDEEGDIFIVYRIKNFLKLAGYRVSTLDLEQKLGHFPGVIELAVVGMEDREMGEAVKLCLVHRQGKEALEELTKFCQANLPAYEQPKAIVFLDELPKLSSGKVDCQALKAWSPVKQSGMEIP